MSEAALLVATLGAPVLLALLLLPRSTRRFAERWASWAALPALVLAVRGASEAPLDLPAVLLGTQLGLTPLTALFLLFTALLWFLAGHFARAYGHDDPRRAAFTAFFLATLTGNLGLVLARDAVTFYAFFALMTFAAYGLVVHSRTPAAERAGRVYIALAVIGEALLLGGLLLAAAEAETLHHAEVRRAIAASEHAPVIVLLLYAGFGVKAGVLPLHVWLPLAHPVAPTPASAVLSGAMIKAGLLGWLVFLPIGAPGFGAWGAGMIAAGLAAAFYAVAVGLTQHDAKTILAYSSVSQMGIITVAVGVALSAPAAAPAAMTAAAVYALHHGLAKGALFLGTGVAAARALPAPVLLALLALPALSLAGAPFSSGAAAKAVLKSPLGAVEWEAAVQAFLSLAALATTLIMARFLFVVARATDRDAWHPLPARGTLAWMGATAASALAPWLVPIEGRKVLPESFGDAWSAAWPVLLGVAIAVAVWRIRGPWRRLHVRPGDVLAVFWAGIVWAYRGATAAGGVVGAAAGPAWDTWVRRWHPFRSKLGEWKAESEARLLAGTGTAALVLVALFVVAGLLARAAAG